MSAGSSVRYAYLVTLVGVVLAGVAVAYNTIRSMFLARAMRVRVFMNSGNFTAGHFGNFTAGQFGNFTANFNGPRRFAYMNPYSGFANNLLIIGAIVAVIGIVWLGITLNRQHRL